MSTDPRAPRMPRAEVVRRARNHAANTIHTALGGGWPDAEEFGYTDDEKERIARELEAIAARLER